MAGPILAQVQGVAKWARCTVFNALIVPRLHESDVNTGPGTHDGLFMRTIRRDARFFVVIRSPARALGGLCDPDAERLRTPAMPGVDAAD